MKAKASILSLLILIYAVNMNAAWAKPATNISRENHLHSAPASVQTNAPFSPVTIGDYSPITQQFFGLSKQQKWELQQKLGLNQKKIEIVEQIAKKGFEKLLANDKVAQTKLDALNSKLDKNTVSETQKLAYVEEIADLKGQLKAYKEQLEQYHHGNPGLQVAEDYQKTEKKVDSLPDEELKQQLTQLLNQGDLDGVMATIKHVEESPPLQAEKQKIAYLESIKGQIYKAQFDYAKAVKAWETAVYLDPNLKDTLWDLANLYWTFADYPKALSTYQALIATKAYNDPDYISLMTCIGNVYDEQGHYSEALAAYEAAKPGYTKLGTDHPDYATLMHRIGIVYDKQGHYSKALAAYDAAKAGYIKLGTDHPEYASLMTCIGVVYDEQGHYSEALAAFEDAKPGYKKLGTDHPSYAKLMMNIGIVYDEQGHYPEALAAYEAAKPGFIKLGTDHPNYARLMMNIGDLYKEQNNLPLAKAYYLKAEPGIQKLPQNHPLRSSLQKVLKDLELAKQTTNNG